MCHYNVCREYVVVASVPPGERDNDTDTTSCTGKCKLSVIKVAGHAGNQLRNRRFSEVPGNICIACHCCSNSNYKINNSCVCMIECRQTVGFLCPFAAFIRHAMYQY